MYQEESKEEVSDCKATAIGKKYIKYSITISYNSLAMIIYRSKKSLARYNHWHASTFVNYQRLDCYHYFLFSFW